MKILVTGATGFVGRHVVTELLKKHYDVVAVARNIDRAKKMEWYKNVEFVECDICEQSDHLTRIFGTVDAIIHLAWPGLPNYNDLFHFEENLPFSYRFLKKLIISGIRQVLVAGTCLEYGVQNGILSEQANALPTTPYGLAKDTLRKFLQELQKQYYFTFQWIRLFYMYGAGQNPDSLLAQLDSAIDRGESEFKMSGGEQLRDYLPVENVAHILVSLLERPEHTGIINCCSGKPVSIRKLVEDRIESRGAKIKLKLGHYPYPEYEPMAFWGCRNKLDLAIGEYGKV